MMSAFPSALGHTEEHLTKCHGGVTVDEKDLLDVRDHAIKIRKFFENHHLGIGAVHIIFVDSFDATDSHRCFPLCEQLFKRLFHHCVTVTGYVSALHEVLRVFHGLCSGTPDAKKIKKAWIVNPALFKVQFHFLAGGVLGLEDYKKEVAGACDDLSQSTIQKSRTHCTMDDNATLICCRVMCFNRAKLQQGKKLLSLLLKNFVQKVNEIVRRDEGLESMFNLESLDWFCE
jgi:hypothetical protein